MESSLQSSSSKIDSLELAISSFGFGSLNGRQVEVLKTVFEERDYFLSEKTYNEGLFSLRQTPSAFKAHRVFMALIEGFVEARAFLGKRDFDWKEYIATHQLGLNFYLKGSTVSTIYTNGTFPEDLDLDVLVIVDEVPTSEEGLPLDPKSLKIFFEEVSRRAIISLLRERGGTIPYWEGFREKFFLFADNSTLLVSFCGIDFSFSLPKDGHYKRSSTFYHESLSIHLPFSEGAFNLSRLFFESKFSATKDEIDHCFYTHLIVIPDPATLAHNGLERVAYSVSKGYTIHHVEPITQLLIDLKTRIYMNAGKPIHHDQLFNLIMKKAKTKEEAFSIFLNAAMLSSHDVTLYPYFNSFLQSKEVITKFPEKIQVFFGSNDFQHAITFLSIKAHLSCDPMTSGLPKNLDLSVEKQFLMHKVKFLKIGDSERSYVALPSLNFYDLRYRFEIFNSFFPEMMGVLFGEIHLLKVDYGLSTDDSLLLFFYNRILISEEISDRDLNDLKILFGRYLGILCQNPKLFSVEILSKGFAKLLEKHSSLFSFEDEKLFGFLAKLTDKPFALFLSIYLFTGSSSDESLRECLKNIDCAKKILTIFMNVQDREVKLKLIPLLGYIFTHHGIISGKIKEAAIEFIYENERAIEILDETWFLFFEENYTLLEPIFQKFPGKISSNVKIFSKILNEENLLFSFFSHLVHGGDDDLIDSLVKKIEPSLLYSTLLRWLHSSDEQKMQTAFKLFENPFVQALCSEKKDEILTIFSELKKKGVFQDEIGYKLLKFFTRAPVTEKSLRFSLYTINTLNLHLLEQRAQFVDFINTYAKEINCLKFNARQKESFLEIVDKCFAIQLSAGNLFNKEAIELISVHHRNLSLEELLKLTHTLLPPKILIDALVSSFDYFLEPLSYEQFEKLLTITPFSEPLKDKIRFHLQKRAHGEHFYEAFFSKCTKKVEIAQILHAYTKFTTTRYLLEKALILFETNPALRLDLDDFLIFLQDPHVKTNPDLHFALLKFVCKKFMVNKTDHLDLLAQTWMEIHDESKLKLLEFFLKNMKHMSFQAKLKLLLSPLTNGTRNNLLLSIGERPEFFEMVLGLIASFTYSEKTSSIELIELIEQMDELAEEFASALALRGSDEDCKIEQHYLLFYISCFKTQDPTDKRVKIINQMIRHTTPFALSHQIIDYLMGKIKYFDPLCVIQFFNSLDLKLFQQKGLISEGFIKIVVEKNLKALESLEHKELHYREMLNFFEKIALYRKIERRNLVAYYITLADIIKTHINKGELINLLTSNLFLLPNLKLISGPIKKRFLNLLSFLFKGEEEKIDIKEIKIDKRFKDFILSLSLEKDNEFFLDLWFSFVHPYYDLKDEDKSSEFFADLMIVNAHPHFFKELITLYKMRAYDCISIATMISIFITKEFEKIEIKSDLLEIYFSFFAARLNFHSKTSEPSGLAQSLIVIRDFSDFIKKYASYKRVTTDDFREFIRCLVLHVAKFVDPHERASYLIDVIACLNVKKFPWMYEMIGIEMLQRHPDIIESILEFSPANQLFTSMKLFFKPSERLKEEHSEGKSNITFLNSIINSVIVKLMRGGELLDALKLAYILVIKNEIILKKELVKDKELILEALNFFVTRINIELSRDVLEDLKRVIQPLSTILVESFDQNWIALFGISIEYLNFVALIHSFLKRRYYNESNTIQIQSFTYKILGLLLSLAKYDSSIKMIDLFEESDSEMKLQRAFVASGSLPKKDVEIFYRLTTLNDELILSHPYIHANPHLDLIKNYLKLLIANLLKGCKYTTQTKEEISQLGQAVIDLENFNWGDSSKISIKKVGIEFINEREKELIFPGLHDLSEHFLESFANISIVFSNFVHYSSVSVEFKIKALDKIVTLVRCVVLSNTVTKIDSNFVQMLFAFLNISRDVDYKLDLQDFSLFYNFLVTNLFSIDLAPDEKARYIQLIMNFYRFNLFNMILNFDDKKQTAISDRVLADWAKHSIRLFQILGDEEKELFYQQTLAYYKAFFVVASAKGNLSQKNLKLVLSYHFLFSLNADRVEDFLCYLKTLILEEVINLSDQTLELGLSFFQAIMQANQTLSLNIDKMIRICSLSKGSPKDLSREYLTWQEYTYEAINYTLLDLFTVILFSVTEGTEEKIESGCTKISADLEISECLLIFNKLSDQLFQSDFHLETVDSILTKYERISRSRRVLEADKDVMLNILRQVRAFLEKKREAC
jgi:hypothetical protein